MGGLLRPLCVLLIFAFAFWNGWRLGNSKSEGVVMELFGCQLALILEEEDDCQSLKGNSIEWRTALGQRNQRKLIRGNILRGKELDTLSMLGMGHSNLNSSWPMPGTRSHIVSLHHARNMQKEGKNWWDSDIDQEHTHKKTYIAEKTFLGETGRDSRLRWKLRKNKD